MRRPISKAQLSARYRCDCIGSPSISDKNGPFEPGKATLRALELRALNRLRNASILAQSQIISRAEINLFEPVISRVCVPKMPNTNRLRGSSHWHRRRRRRDLYAPHQEWGHDVVLVEVLFLRLRGFRVLSKPRQGWRVPRQTLVAVESLLQMPPGPGKPPLRAQR